MSLTLLTSAQIRDNVVAQLALEFGQAIPFLPKSFIRVLATVLGGVFVTLYKYGGFVFLQQFVRTASASPTTVNGITVTPLIEWGRLIGVGDPILATNAVLTVTVTVENQTGVLRSGEQLVSSMTGVTYLVVSDVALSAATVSANIIAVADQAGGQGGGTIGNLSVSDVVSFVNPIANVAKDTVVSAVVTTGADGEDVDTAYRARVLKRFQKRPQGGAYADYQAWGEEVAGILNVYPYTGAPGEVDIYVESATEVDGIPTAPQLAAVLAAVNEDVDGIASRRNCNAYPNVISITRKGFDVEITSLASPTLVATKASIEDALDEYFLGREPFIDGLSGLPKTNKITATAIIGLIDEIVALAGGTFTTAEFFETGLAVALTDWTLIEGQKAKVVTVSYV